MTPQMNTYLLHGDPKDVDKIMANELNALTFDDREALSEEVHGVRSLAPVETPEMIQKALIDLRSEFIDRLKLALVSLPSLPFPHSARNSHHIDDSSDTINSDDISRREYLNDLLDASNFFASSSSCSSRVEEHPDSMKSNCSLQYPASIPTPIKESSTEFQSCGGSSLNNSSSYDYKGNRTHSRNYTKYSYALSDGFRLKFLRAELFDVKKAATRYLKCIDFLVAYFGLVALERPLYLKDLDKDEQKLIREGRCQLMPSRDRLGRRIVVFQGAVGKGYSHHNTVRICGVPFELHLLFIIEE